MLAARSEIRAATGHWAQGFTALGESITRHDRRMADGSCCTCALLALLDEYLHPGRTCGVETAGEVG